MTEQPIIVWFRNDLRIEDNPALHATRESNAPVIALYILDDAAPWAPGGASRWWLHHSLNALDGDLRRFGARLTLRRGDAAKTLLSLAAETGAQKVVWNRRYYSKHVEIDKSIKSTLADVEVQAVSFNGSLLREPWEVKTKSGGPYRVFTPFWKSLRDLGPSAAQFPVLRKLNAPTRQPESDKLEDWDLSPANPDWAREFKEKWTPGEHGAHQRLKAFLDDAIDSYADGRNRPDKAYTSRLSPHLAFGEISPARIRRETKAAVERKGVNEKQADKFLSELAWREFSYHLLYHNDAMPEEPLRENFARFHWQDNERHFAAWTKGQTGYPIVDAGMRQLWRTGWMHNRVRMIAASFLIKDLLIPWQKGEAWFWDTLVDADLANNAASWQWVAGCGADAAPYFRIFNPVTQGERFDPDGAYVREYVPELRRLSAKHIHQPWTAPENDLQKAGVTLGKTYPNPIVDHAQARRQALEFYDKIKAS